MRLAMLILVSVLYTVSQISQIPDTIILKFERKVIQNNSTEIVKGTAYYKSPHTFHIDVQFPIKQIMRIEENVLIIYYPIEKKAFKIKSKGYIPIPFIQAILFSMKNDYGLSEMGYNLVKNEYKENMLYTYWNPPKKQMGKFILGTENGLLKYAEVLDPKGKTIIKSTYGQYKDFNGKYLPLEIHTDIFDGKKRSEEYVTYNEIKLNIVLPKEIINFTLPDSISIKSMDW